MKTMKTIKLYIVAAVALTIGLFAACTDYRDEVDALEERLDALKARVDSVNTNIAYYQTFMDAVATGDIITRIDTIYWDNNKEKTEDNIKSFKIFFQVHDPIIIEKGKQGEKGDKGDNGHTPQLEIRQDETDLIYYWCMDGEWIRNPVTNERFPAVGQNAETPKIRIKNGQLEINFTTGYPESGWIVVSYAVKGDKGIDATTYFDDVKVSDNRESVTFITKQSGEVTIPLLTVVTNVEIFGDDNQKYTISNPVNVSTIAIRTLTAKLTPNSDSNTSYKKVLWYVSEGNTEDITITQVTNNPLSIQVQGMRVDSSVKLTCVALYSTMANGDPVQATCTVNVVQ